MDCPACRKSIESERELACPRCGCDLTQLQSILAGARRYTAMAAVRLRGGDYEAALVEAERSWRLRRSFTAAMLAFNAAAGLRDTQRADLWHTRADLLRQ